MEKNNYPNRLVDICQRIKTMFEWDFEGEEAAWEQTKWRQVSMNESLKHTVWAGLLEADNDYAKCIVALHDAVFYAKHRHRVGLADYIKFAKREHFDVRHVAETNALIGIIQDIFSLYDEWKADEFAGVIDLIKQNKVLFPNETSAEFDPQMILDINSLVKNNKIKISLYRNGGDVIKRTDKFRIGNNVGFSTDLTMWLAHVERQQDYISAQAENEVFVTLFGKIDETHEIYSSWLLVLQKGRTIWVATDALYFDNTYQKNARLGRRSVWDNAENLWEMCDLPYRIFHSLDDLRAEQKNVVHARTVLELPFDSSAIKTSFDEDVCEAFEHHFAKALQENSIDYTSIKVHTNHGRWRVTKMEAKKAGRYVAIWSEEDPKKIRVMPGHPEFLFKPLAEFEDGEKMFIVFLVNSLLDQFNIREATLPTVMLATEHIKMRLLEGARIQTTETSHVTYFTDTHKAVFNEIFEVMEELDPTVSKALVPVGYAEAIDLPTWNASALKTAQQHDAEAEWNVLNNIKESMSPALQMLKNRKEEDWKELRQMFRYRKMELLNMLFQHDEIDFVGYGFPAHSDNKEMVGVGYALTGDKSKSSTYSSILVGQNYKGDEMCHCGRFKASAQKIIHVRFYKQLMWLLGLTDRKELPAYFRSYRAHNLIPYTGNSITGNTHPFTRIEDPASRESPNGIDVFVHCCGFCARKLKAERWKSQKTVVVIEGEMPDSFNRFSSTIIKFGE
jgi:hypothetical protein